MAGREEERENEVKGKDWERTEKEGRENGVKGKGWERREAGYGE